MHHNPDRSLGRQEASITDSAITVDPQQLPRLKLKLHEYRYRQAGRPDIAFLDESSLAIHGFTTLHELFKRMVLDIVVELTETEGRGTRAQPITLPEVAWYFGQQSGIDVTSAVYGPKAIPFVYDHTTNWHTPAFAQAPDQPSNLDELFVGAYGVIRAYASNRQDTLQGGSGLATIPQPVDYADDWVD